MSAQDPAEIYRQEASELLDQLEQALLDLERNPADADLVNQAFRALRTIKGSGANVSATAELIALTLAARDQIRQLIEHPNEADDTEAEVTLDSLHTIVGGAAEHAVATASPASVSTAAPATWSIVFSLACDAMALGTKPLLLLDELRSLGPCTVVADTSGIPPFEELDPPPSVTSAGA